MLFKSPNPSLIKDVYVDFERRFRWKYHFEVSGTGQAKPYDPDYDLHEVSETEPPSAPPFIENGLARGRAFIDHFCDIAEPVLTARYRKSRVVWLAELKNYLDEHDYVITSTDKNLGAAVVTRDWLILGARQLLSDTSNYACIDESRVDLVVDKIRDSLTKLTEERVHDWCMSESDPQLFKFLRSKMPEDPIILPQFPEFYAIPKIHKNPTGYRPIVPCHSAITEPACKVVSKMLKPLYQQCPHVIHGSKDLAGKLSKLSLLQHRKVFIVTADIVAYYPNIPLNKAVPIVLKMFMEYASIHDYPPWKKHLFITCLQIGVKSPLIMKFMNKFYEQLKGVPMGASCSPDIANLYGAFFENQFMNPPNPSIPFFGRYIDDCLAIVYASTAEEALALCGSVIIYDDVQLTWSASEWNQPFLDMQLYIDPKSNQVEHLPYRKPLNHLERIPWASHHPPDVKRGTFYGEMSRLATLSSQQLHYLDAIKGLKYLYIARGYPPVLLNKWIKAQSAKRWRQRLDEPREDTSELFVLKSEFNPAWQDFNIKNLFYEIKNVWLQGQPHIIRCDLQGRCALHNSATLKNTVPHDLLVLENKRLSTSKFKYSITGNTAMEVDTLPTAPQSRKRGWSPQQTTLEQHWDAGSPGPSGLKRQKVAASRYVAAGPIVIAESSDSVTDEGLPDSPVLIYSALPPVAVQTRLEDREVFDFSVTCLSSDPTLPRRDAPVGPVSWAVEWGFGPRSGLYLEQKLVPDFNKTGFCDRRMLVSRKRTINVFDLASAWRKAIINSELSEGEIPDDSLNAWT
jgi:hypothetical protein